MQAPSCFRYLDYRSFLKDVFDYQRRTQKLTARKLFAEAGFKSLGHFYLVTQGKAHLKPEKLESVARAWKVRPSEIPYLLKLREFCAAKALSDKERAYGELELLRSDLKVRLLTKSEVESISRWYAIPLLEAITCISVKPQLDKMARFMGVPVADLKKCIEIFERLGLVTREGERFRRGHEFFEAQIAESSKAIREMHREFIEKAFQSVTKDPKERYLMTLSIPLGPKQLEKVVKEANQFFQRINRDYQKPEQADAVYQMNLQLFPIVPLKEA